MTNEEKLITFKMLLLEYIKTVPGSDGLPYIGPNAGLKILLEIVACHLDRIPMADLPFSLPNGSADDLAMIRINQIKRKAIEEMTESVEPVKVYPSGYSQEILSHDSAPKIVPNDSGENLQNLLEMVQSYESEIASLNETIEELMKERDHLQQLADESQAAGSEEHDSEDAEAYDETEGAADDIKKQEIEELREAVISLKIELEGVNSTNLDLIRDRDYWKVSFEELEDSLRSDAAKNNLEVSKKYKLHKLSQVEFLNNLIATEHYTTQQISFIQHCLLQNIPIKIVSECVSAALPVFIMEDYISYSCRKSKIDYQPYHSPTSEPVPSSST